MLAAADPAQPYGAALPWPKRAGARAARVAGAHVVLLGGEPALFVERGGRSLVPLRDPDDEWLRAGARRARRARAPRRRASGSRSSGSTASRSARAMPAAARRGRVPRRPAPRRPAPLGSGLSDTTRLKQWWDSGYARLAQYPRAEVDYA